MNVLYGILLVGCIILMVLLFLTNFDPFHSDDDPPEGGEFGGY